MTAAHVPISVETGPEEDEGPDRPATMVSVSICSPDRMHFNASGMLQGDADEVSDAAIADAIVRVALAAAHARSSGLWIELQRAITHHGTQLGGVL